MIEYAYLFLFSKMFLKFIHVIAYINSETAYFFLSFAYFFLLLSSSPLNGYITIWLSIPLLMGS